MALLESCRPEWEGLPALSNSGIPNSQKARPISTASDGTTLDAPLTIGVPTREEDGVGEISPMPGPPRRTTPHPTNAKKQAFVGTRIGGCRGPRLTPHQPQQRRVLGTPSRTPSTATAPGAGDPVARWR